MSRHRKREHEMKFPRRACYKCELTKRGFDTWWKLLKSLEGMTERKRIRKVSNHPATLCNPRSNVPLLCTFRRCHYTQITNIKTGIFLNYSTGNCFILVSQPSFFVELHSAKDSARILIEFVVVFAQLDMMG